MQIHKLIFFLFLLLTYGCKSSTYSGFGEASDGDSILLNKAIKIRLWGIDAPEYDQQCTQGSKKVDCGRKAQKFLESLLQGGKISCRQKDIDHYGRIIAICKTNDNIEINKRLVEEGWAIDYTRYSGARYRMIEYRAKRENKGLWQYTFDLPYIWRQNNPYKS